MTLKSFTRFFCLRLFFFTFLFTLHFSRTPALFADISNGMNADVVIGQADLVSNRNNQGGNASARTLSGSHAIFADGRRFYVADRDNRRVLIYDSIPRSNNAEAIRVLGQPDFVTQAPGVSSAANFNNPQGIASDGKFLIISDQGRNRILIYNSLPTANGAPAEVVIGQTNLTNQAANQGGAVAGNTISAPQNVELKDGRLFITDSGNHRILIFNQIPTANNATADLVLGQANFAASAVGVGPAALNSPRGIFFDGQRLFIGDFGNNRVLIYHGLPSANGAAADVVVGQPDFISVGANQGGGPTRFSMNGPRSVFSDGRRLFVADSTNSRVLVYESIPETNGAPADFVIGQPDFTSGARNQGGGVDAFTLDRPRGLFVVGSSLLVGDHSNNRVVIYNFASSSTNLGPQFSQGKSVVGKVFWDLNGDGRQDG